VNDGAVAHGPGYGPRSTRRTKPEISALEWGLYEIVVTNRPMTVRQVFYQAVSRGLIAKTEAEYKGTVGRLLTRMRRRWRTYVDMVDLYGKDDGARWLQLAGPAIRPGWIADNTRWMRKPQTHSSLDEMLRDAAQFYRRALWDSQPAYVEVWLEKDALAGVLLEVTGEWDVPLMVTRGYPSYSYLEAAGEVIADQDKPVHLYYFGDRDPSGVDIPRHVEKALRDFAPAADITFEIVAVTSEQVMRWNLPTRPTKRSDTRSRAFVGDSVEVDAIPPEHLREMVRRCIERHIDQHQLDVLLVAESEERLVLEQMARRYGT
jgi:hypothetical protein